MTCPGCEGTGTMLTHVPRYISGHRICQHALIPCPLCHGRKEVTQEELEAFLQTAHASKLDEETL
jgi:hypothetical protein